METNTIKALIAMYADFYAETYGSLTEVYTCLRCALR